MFTIKVEHLLDCMKPLQSYVGNGRNNAMERMLYIQGDDTVNITFLRVTNGSEICGTNIKPMTCQTMKYNLIDFDILYKLLQTLEPTSSITIDNGPNFSLYIIHQGTKKPITISGLDPTNFPYQFPKLINQRLIQIPHDQFITAINSCGSIINHDDRYQLYNCINISVDGSNYKFESIDSLTKRLMILEMNSGSLTNKGQVHLEYNRIKKISNFTPSVYVELDIGDNGTMINSGYTWLYLPNIAGSYPDCKKLLPSSSITSFEVARLSLLDLLERVKIIAVANNGIAKFGITKTDLLIEAISNNGNISESINISNFIGKEFDCSFKLESIIESIKGIKTSTIDISFPNPNTAIISSVGAPIITGKVVVPGIKP